jgi:arylsulfatase A-like enzyme
MVSHLDIYPTLCDIAGAERPDFLQGTSLLPLVTDQTDRIHDEIFTEVTFHAAYEPTRAIRTERWKYIRRFDDYPGPVLANCDDSETKSLLVAAGWGEREVPRERLYDLVLDPAEGEDLAARAEFAEQLADLRTRLERWMHETDDPLLGGPVEPPPGALVNEQWQVSPDEPLRALSPGPTVAPSS